MCKITLKDLEKTSNVYDFFYLFYDTNEIGNLEPPIDLNMILEKLSPIVRVDDGINIDLLNHSGFIQVNREGEEFKFIKVWANLLEKQERRRFTIAHELGHLVHDIIPKISNIEENENFLDLSLHRTSGVVNIVEKRANEFAARLLMPAFLVKRELKKTLDYLKENKKEIVTEHVLERLASKFEVSVYAMIIRLKNLKLLKRDYQHPKYQTY